MILSENEFESRRTYVERSGTGKHRYPPIETDLMKPHSASIEARTQSNVGDRLINRRSKHQATRSVKFALESPAASMSTEKGETIPDALGSIAIMATAIADRKAV
ncbi:hypothetical protein G5I_11849 [Acromyrmex echinatior]|uniref:Uncharacterized protein n=1 Tax=Acromyrmex echinatior TaxID=103372 RepID=F4X0R6_ACREC|nr:hypothetical protein G5I_11849 [Acromyrmex echinatior]